MWHSEGARGPRWGAVSHHRAPRKISLRFLGVFYMAKKAWEKFPLHPIRTSADGMATEHCSAILQGWLVPLPGIARSPPQSWCPC